MFDAICSRRFSAAKNELPSHIRSFRICYTVLGAIPGSTDFLISIYLTHHFGILCLSICCGLLIFNSYDLRTISCRHFYCIMSTFFFYSVTECKPSLLQLLWSLYLSSIWYCWALHHHHHVTKFSSLLFRKWPSADIFHPSKLPFFRLFSLHALRVLRVSYLFSEEFVDDF